MLLVGALQQHFLQCEQLELLIGILCYGNYPLSRDSIAEIVSDKMDFSIVYHIFPEKARVFMRAVINVPVCRLYSRPGADGQQVDEALLGWPVEVLEAPAPGWVYLRTHYRYEGYARRSDLYLGSEVCRWAERRKRVVLQAIADVLVGPEVTCPHVTTLVRGCVVAAGGDDGGRWRSVTLPDGREGYVRGDFLGEYHESAPALPEEVLRRRIADTALGYLGVQYRWGGKTPMGVDCSGLTAMAYLLNGILIYRDAKLAEGFPIRPIDPTAAEVADLLYFPGHVALCLGEGRYIHAAARSGRVVINSLNPACPDYRADLAGSLLAAGSWFPCGAEAPPQY